MERKLGEKPIEYDAARLATLILGGVTWTDWTPTLTQLAAVSSTVPHCRYCRIGNVCLVYAQFNVTGAEGTAGNDITIGQLPVAPHQTGLYMPVGHFLCADVTVGYYQGAVIAPTATTLKFVANGYTGNLGSTPSFKIDNGDYLAFTLVYEVA